MRMYEEERCQHYRRGILFGVIAGATILNYIVSLRYPSLLRAFLFAHSISVILLIGFTEKKLPQKLSISFVNSFLLISLNYRNRDSKGKVPEVHIYFLRMSISVEIYRIHIYE
uniref:Uncharacterized protein n=1 Tax=Ascaris lumbricoides TaxID=6252 RepID=A0A9J2PMG8_ASCLU